MIIRYLCRKRKISDLNKKHIGLFNHNLSITGYYLIIIPLF